MSTPFDTKFMTLQSELSRILIQEPDLYSSDVINGLKKEMEELKKKHTQESILAELEAVNKKLQAAKKEWEAEKKERAEKKEQVGKKWQVSKVSNNLYLDDPVHRSRKSSAELEKRTIDCVACDAQLSNRSTILAELKTVNKFQVAKEKWGAEK
ncbi:uncharacterized protein FA14DRAFT_154536 [Meira miltonrushii]|uniref:Uncharacterized protein n=1 Tax=Meira miltonrushii TaxID=1280837 RepID=A0A316VDD8_9BASI|nr:uncharacterized protein FA14DRAFT_154536 [Meira miltonrushii]PWN35108.1 hypothetical protein FA14DRAFT_154536 [Meira miltonrushii]